MGLRLVTAPTDSPVSLEEAKAHLRVEFTDDDDLIEIFRKAATDVAEQFTGRAFVAQTWDMLLDAFPTTGPIRVPKPPLLELVGVFYNDGSGTEQTVDAADYIVGQANDGAFAAVSLAYGAAWPTAQSVADAVRVRFRAGYVNGDSPPLDDVPFAIKAAILMTIGTLYAHRETIVIGQSVAQLPWAAEQLLLPYRVHTAMA